MDKEGERGGKYTSTKCWQIISCGHFVEATYRGTKGKSEEIKATGRERLKWKRSGADEARRESV